MAKKLSPIAQAVRSARFLVEAITDLEMYSSIHHEKRGEPLLSLSEDNYLAVTDTLANAGQELRNGVVDLHRELKIPGVWKALCEANVSVASIAGRHDQCFCGAVFQIALDRYSQVLHMSSADEWHEWMQLGPRPQVFPEIQYQRVIDNLESVIQVMTFGEGINRAYAAQALLKERNRADDAPPDDDGVEYPNERRDAWIYNERRRGQTLSQIQVAISKRDDGWDPLLTPQAVFGASTRYADRKNLPRIKHHTG